MDESTWMTCTDPQSMLEFLRGKASERKLRLFACACCRDVRGVLTEGPGRSPVEVAQATGIDAATLGAVLAGTHQLTREQIGALARHFQVSPSVFAFGE